MTAPLSEPEAAPALGCGKSFWLDGLLEVCGLDYGHEGNHAFDPAPPPPPEPSDAHEVAAHISNAIMQVCDEHGPLAPAYATKIIEAIIQRFEGRTRQDERERAARDLCSLCRKGSAVIFQADIGWGHEWPVNQWTNCDARAIWRGAAIRGGGK